jgi:RHS repeat-associated protein
MDYFSINMVIICKTNGTEVFKASYDAWGKQTVTLNTIGFHRGYTGHEHLPEFGLINMNGRLYDPAVGRFLSPDPYVADDTYSQDFNRYSYVRNNPLIYTDPDGEVPWLIPAIKVLATMYMAGVQSNFFHAANNGDNPFNPGNWNWKSPWTYTSLASAGYGAFLDVGGIAAFKGTTASNPFASNPEQVTRWLNYTNDKNSLLAGPGIARYVGNNTYEATLEGVTIMGKMGRAGRHAQIMANPLVQSIHRGGIAFWSTISTFANSLNHGVLNPDNIPQYVGGTVPVPGRFRGGANVAKGGTNILSKGETLRIQNAANRINKPIHVVGSRARGVKTGDWDYIIEGGLKNSREWSKIKNSLPGARSVLDNTPRNIDILKGTLDLTKPHITIYPYIP